MGSHFSRTIEPEEQYNCPICNTIVKKNFYIDLQCTKCNERYKGYVHNECIKKLYVNGNKLICVDCYYKNKDTIN